MILFSCMTAKKFHRYGEENPKEAIKFIKENYPVTITGSDTTIVIIDSTFEISISPEEKKRLIDSAIKATGIEDSLLAVYSLGLDEGFQIGFESAKQKFENKPPKTIVKEIKTRYEDSAKIKERDLIIEDKNKEINKVEKKNEDLEKKNSKLQEKVISQRKYIWIISISLLGLLIFLFRKPIWRILRSLFI